LCKRGGGLDWLGWWCGHRKKRQAVGVLQNAGPVYDILGVAAAVLEEFGSLLGKAASLGLFDAVSWGVAPGDVEMPLGGGMRNLEDSK